MSSIRAKIGPSGRLLIPAAQRREVGDQVLLETDGGELRVSSLEHRIARVQALVREHNESGANLSDSLIRDRRAKAAKD